VVFSTRSKETRTLTRAIEARLETGLGYRTDAFIRTDAQIAAIAAHRSFPASQLAAAKTLNIGFLAAPLSAARVRTLAGFKSDVDDFHVNGAEVYWLCRTRQSESQFSNAVFEKALGVRGTWRGANTIRRLAAKYPP
jgi:uncharacterized protein (DUF1697 family)